MPVSKKRKKEGRNKSRDRGEAANAPAPPPAPAAEPAGGLLTRMRGGFQRVAGTALKKKESPLSKIITWAIVLLAAYFVARKLGILP
ncbi:MAG TPA: hypothetical protein VEP66_00110 [Myxococcales bacterium]|nr:hypothetical protein [Myxococcales bacterium]